jgi:hypothetical protein
MERIAINFVSIWYSVLADISIGCVGIIWPSGEAVCKWQMKSAFVRK